MLGFIFMQIGGPFCGTTILFYFGSFFDLDVIEFEYIIVNGGKHGVGVIWVPCFFNLIVDARIWICYTLKYFINLLLYIKSYRQEN